ncbi:MAG: cobyrinate a,c-diamide synthase [Alphaproteobacteria bacterium]
MGNSATSGPAGLIVAAPSSGSGKTVFTLGLLRHLSRAGVDVSSAKAGPDYIDPAFHAAATGKPCYNLDSWAMRPELLAETAAGLSDGAGMVVCEGVMGLFDGATAEQGSTADLSEITGWPVVLLIDAGSQGASAAAVLRGFATHRPGLTLAGVVFNRTGGERHEAILRDAVARMDMEIPVLGCLPRRAGLSLPDRHLGLVQAVENSGLERFLDSAANLIAEFIDVDALRTLSMPLKGPASTDAVSRPLPPLGQRIAVAKDEAFSFRYSLTLEGWQAQGAEISFFSPLDDEAPSADADAVYLPGGYPELHGFRLATSNRFMDGLRTAADRGAMIYGECGGYMVLGKSLTDADGQRHAMAGLLGLETSFAERKLHLGYRDAVLDAGAALGSGNVLGGPGTRFRGHEFHYASVLKEGPGAPLFSCSDVAGSDLGLVGLSDGRVMGSFIHLIDHVADDA